MKTLRFILIYLFIPVAFASGRVAGPVVSLNFDAMPLQSFVKQTYGDILTKPYSIAPDLPSAAVTIHAEVPIDELEATLDSVLAGYGIEKREVKGILMFSRVKDKPVDPVPGQGSDNVTSAPVKVEQDKPLDSVQFYRPRFRRPADLQAIANKLSGVDFEPSIDTVTVAGSADKVASIMAALAMYDVPVKQLVIKGAILEFTSDSSDASGFGLAIDAFRSNVQSVLGSVVVKSDYVRIGSDDVSAIINAVSSDTRFSVISQPTIRVRNGETGRIQIGDSTPTLSETTINSTNSNSTQSIVYKDSGVILETKPSIQADSIELSINQELSSFQKNNTSGIDSPILSQRRMSTVVNTRFGETILLAGLDSQQDNDSNSGFALLPSWAKTRSKSSKHTQILLVLSIGQPEFR